MGHNARHALGRHEALDHLEQLELGLGRLQGNELEAALGVVQNTVAIDVRLLVEALGRVTEGDNVCWDKQRIT